MSYRGVYVALAAVMVAGLLATLFAAIPAPPLQVGASAGRRVPRPAGPRVWRIPAVLFAIALISVTFFGDGAAARGRRAPHRGHRDRRGRGRRRAAPGGVHHRPVVPTTLSLAGHSAPGRSGQAVATTTAAGYGAFIVSPLTIGLLAQATSLRLALALLS